MSAEEKTNDDKEFHCTLCKLKVKYHYFGKKPPFAKSIGLIEDTYIMKDPFSTEGGIISLGSHCHVCNKSVCASTACSVFYTARFCSDCVLSNLEEFPKQIQQEVLKRGKATG